MPIVFAHAQKVSLIFLEGEVFSGNKPHNLTAFVMIPSKKIRETFWTNGQTPWRHGSFDLKGLKISKMAQK